MCSVLLGILTLLAAACGPAADDVRVADPTSDTPLDTSANLAEQCTNPEHGYSLSYPVRARTAAAPS